MVEAPALRRYSQLIAVAILILGLVFYLYRIDRWFMDDDEGGFCYAAWRIAAGEMPYRDFLTEQVPLFLYWGATLIRLFGPSIMALRYATVVATLLAAYFIYLAARPVFGWRVAILSLPLFILHKDIYLIARFFRPEAYMLLFGAMGTYAFVRAYPGRRGGLFLSGAMFGLGLLFKLFAALPAAGCGLFILYRWARSRERHLVGDLLALAAGLLATAGTVLIAFQITSPFFVTAVLKLHIMQGAELSRLQVLAKGLGFYWSYLTGSPVFLLLAMLGVTKALGAQSDSREFYSWQIPTAASFLFLSRDLQDRHLVYLVPALCVLTALSLERIMSGDLLPLAARYSDGHIKTRTGRWLLLVFGVSACTVALWPFWQKDMEVASWEDSATQQFARYIQAHTEADDIVLSDYLELNFHAQRRTTYLGAGLSAVSTSSGRITGTALIDEIQGFNAEMVLINTSGGAHHFVSLPDFDTLYRYVQGHFRLVGLFHRSYQTFEIYYRDELLPLLPGINFSGEVALTGADLGRAVAFAGQDLAVTLRWQALDAMQRDYTVSLRLLDAQGHGYGQQDVPLQRAYTSRWDGSREIIEQTPTSRWASGEVVMADYKIPVVDGAPPGTYRLVALLYDLASGEVLQAGEQDGPKARSTYVLRQVEIARPEEVPALDELPIQSKVMQDFGGQLQLLGYGPLAEQTRSGDSLRLGLFWRALRQMQSNWQLLLRIQAANGEIVSEDLFELANPDHPTSQWVEGEVVLGQYDLVLDRSAPSGQAQIILDLVDKDTRRNLLGHDWVLAVVDIDGRPRQFQLPEGVGHPLNANLGNHVLLLGYDIDKEAPGAGGTISLTLHWQALAEMDTSYTVFIHLLDGNDRIWGQLDSVPAQGTYPTTGWLPGEVVTDRCQIQINSEAPSGSYVLEVGLYNAVSGVRLALVDAQGQVLGNRILLSSVELAD